MYSNILTSNFRLISKNKLSSKALPKKYYVQEFDTPPRGTSYYRPSENKFIYTTTNPEFLHPTTLHYEVEIYTLQAKTLSEFFFNLLPLANCPTSQYFKGISDIKTYLIKMAHNFKPYESRARILYNIEDLSSVINDDLIVICYSSLSKAKASSTILIYDMVKEVEHSIGMFLMFNYSPGFMNKLLEPNKFSENMYIPHLLC